MLRAFGQVVDPVAEVMECETLAVLMPITSGHFLDDFDPRKWPGCRDVKQVDFLDLPAPAHDGAGAGDRAPAVAKLT
ncbi:hypothetical protein D9M72_591190 [compost metagenome]